MYLIRYKRQLDIKANSPGYIQAFKNISRSQSAQFIEIGIWMLHRHVLCVPVLKKKINQEFELKGITLIVLLKLSCL